MMELDQTINCVFCKEDFNASSNWWWRFCASCTEEKGIDQLNVKPSEKNETEEMMKMSYCIICKKMKSVNIHTNMCDDCNSKIPPKPETKNLVVKLPNGSDARFNDIGNENWRSDLLYFENIGHSGAKAQHFFPKSSIAGWSIYHQKEQEKK